MDLGMTPKVKPLVEKVRAMVRDEIMPLEEEYEAEVGKEGDRWVYTKRQTEILEGLKAKARERGLWNFWLTGSDKGYGLTTVEYAYLAEEMGWSRLAPETFNCSAPDTGNMEVLERYGSPEHKEKWLEAAAGRQDPLGLRHDRAGRRLLGRHQHRHGRASSTATSGCSNGEKWFASGAGDPRCKIYIVMVCTDPDAPSKHKQHSQILVPAGTKGVEILRAHAGLRRRRRAARPHAHPLHRRARAEGEPDPRRAGAASRSRRAGSGRAASTTACAPSARPSGRWS